MRNGSRKLCSLAAAVILISLSTTGCSSPGSGSSDEEAESLPIERVSVNTGGTQGDGESYNPSISADGRYIAFRSLSTNLVDGDSNGARDYL